MSVKFLGHDELLQARKTLAASGFITYKENHDPHWTLLVATGSEPGRSSDATVVGTLYSLQRRATDTHSLPSNMTFTLRFNFVEPDKEEMMHSFWNRDFARRQKKIAICNYRKSSLAPSSRILNDIIQFRKDIQHYSAQVVLPRELVRKAEQTIHRETLPFYLAGFTPQMCSAAFRFGVSAASPVATALREGRVSVEKAAEYVDMPHEWAVPLLFNNMV